MRVRLNADPVVNGQPGERRCQVTVDVADALRSEVGHQTRRLGDHDRSDEWGVLLARKHFDAIVVEALTRVVLMRRRRSRPTRFIAAHERQYRVVGWWRL